MQRLNKALAKRILETVDVGLVNGMGEPVPGHMCVEAAVCYALGLPHSDKPPCVGKAVRLYKIGLNDAQWSNNAARARGMRRVAIAQLGSNKIDQRAFAEYIIIQGVRRILPIVARAAAKRNPKHADAILAAVPACEAAASLSDARQAAAHLRSAAYAANAADAAYAAASAAAYTAAYIAAYAAAYAAASAAVAANDAAYAANAADAAAAYAAVAANDATNAAATRDEVLSLAAEIAVEALQAQNCEGCQWLHLTEK